MRYLVVFTLMILVSACGNGNAETEKDKSDTSTIGVDSTKVGADSGILRKLP